MAGIIDSIKSTLLPAPEDASGALHTLDLSSAPGGYKHDEPSALDTLSTEQLGNETSKADKPASQGGPLRAPHLSADRQDSLDALSTRAVKNEPIEHPAESGALGGGGDGLSALRDGNDSSSTPGPNSGLHPHVASKFARDFSKYDHPDSTLAPHSEGRPGAYDADGRKVHDASDSQPKSFGILGGAHLNSPDNRPETAGTSSALPQLDEPDQAVQMAGILGPGPAMTQLPPTEPASSAHTPALGDRGDSNTGPFDETKTSPSSNLEDSQQPSVQQANSEHSLSRSVHSSGIPTTAARIGSQDPTLGLDPRQTLAQTEKNAEKDTVHDDELAGQKVKVPLGDKIKGLVTEIKGVVKKDPEVKEHGKALRTGNA